MTKYVVIVSIMFFSIALLTNCNSNQSSLGIFEANSDIGDVIIEGSVDYNSEDGSYTIYGSGKNMWSEKDAFHYVWEKVSGDISLSTKMSWIGKGKNPHRKGGIIIRQNLNPGSPYVDAVVHGDGLTSIQYREKENGLTHEIQMAVKSPDKIRIEKEDNYFFMSAAIDENELQPTGGGIRIKLEDPYYIGIGVCSHDKNVKEGAVFTNVEIETIKPKIGEKAVLESTLETINIESKNRKVVYHTNGRIEAPNWSLDGTYFVFNSGGLLYKLPVGSLTPAVINTDKKIRCNNDHGISPDDKLIVISDHTEGDNKSRIYTLPIDGGIPKLVTKKGPSYWHGWSPDGKTLTYCAERNGQYDVYYIPVEGGNEIQLTNTEGLDDGPDYSPCGKYIYFNSVRTGRMQIWRMNIDGSEQIQLTSDEYNDWFPHPSPDGKWIVFVSFEKEVKGHPSNKDVMLRMMSTESGEVQVLTKLFGGQGTINVPSWSPDSKNVAFVSYRLK